MQSLPNSSFPLPFFVIPAQAGIKSNQLVAGLFCDQPLSKSDFESAQQFFGDALWNFSIMQNFH